MWQEQRDESSKTTQACLLGNVVGGLWWTLFITMEQDQDSQTDILFNTSVLSVIFCYFPIGIQVKLPTYTLFITVISFGLKCLSKLKPTHWLNKSLTDRFKNIPLWLWSPDSRTALDPPCMDLNCASMVSFTKTGPHGFEGMAVYSHPEGYKDSGQLP